MKNWENKLYISDNHVVSFKRSWSLRRFLFDAGFDSVTQTFWRYLLFSGKDDFIIPFM